MILYNARRIRHTNNERDNLRDIHKAGKLEIEEEFLPRERWMLLFSVILFITRYPRLYSAFKYFMRSESIKGIFVTFTHKGMQWLKTKAIRNERKHIK